MRWIILALSLGTSVVSVFNSVFMLFGAMPAETGALPPWLAGSLPIASALLALVGGFVAFGRNRMGSVFLMLAALLCIIAPTEFWIYGSLYLIATVFCFFLPRRSHFDDDEDYEDDELEEPEDEPLVDPRELPSRRRERTARIPSAPQEREKAIPLSKPSEELFKIRKRTSKTCPTCGANVAIDHQFCPTCGSSLHIPADSRTEDSSVPGPEAREALSRNEGPRDPSAFVSVPEPGVSDGERMVPPLPEVEPVAEGPSGDEFPPPEDFRVSAPHKVFVKPRKESASIPIRPLNIDPDASYQEFSQYARRKKRRTRSLGRRVLGMLLLLTVVGGTTWFLLGLRKLPENQLPVRPVEESEPESPLPAASRDVVAEPLAVVPSGGELPALVVRDRPERGRVTGSNVNLREDHSTASKSITRLQPNARGEILDTWEGTSGTLSGLWYRIRTGDGKEGWIYGQYFLPVGEGLPKGYTDALLKSFGAGRTEAVAELGQPARSRASSLNWQGLTMTLNGESITRIQLSSPGRELRNGVKVGMSQRDLLGIMGYPSHPASGQWRYVEADGKGVGVQLEKDGSVKSVTVGQL